MRPFFQTARTRLVSAACGSLLAFCVPGAFGQAQVQSVRLLPASGAVELEIQTTQPIAPRSQVVTAPDRLVIDFPNTTPGPQLRALTVNRGDLTGVRVGLFASHPPTTRVVLDLKTASAYQIFPSGKSVMIKLGSQPAPAASNAAPDEADAPVEPPKPKVTVAFQNGLLSINADKATLAQVLYEIHSRTGAEIAVPAGAEQEQVFTSLGPAAPKDVLAALLDGSPYNFILVGSSSNPNVLERVLLSRKGTSMTLDVGMPQNPGANAPTPVYADTARMRNRGTMQPPPDPEPAPEEEINNMPADEEPQPGDVQPVDNPQTGAPQNQGQPNPGAQPPPQN
jgi:hypothetical protein